MTFIGVGGGMSKEFQFIYMLEDSNGLKTRKIENHRIQYQSLIVNIVVTIQGTFDGSQKEIENSHVIL